VDEKSKTAKKRNWGRYQKKSTGNQLPKRVTESKQKGETEGGKNDILGISSKSGNP